MERGIVADIALVHAHTADLAGNLTYRYSARNFNPAVATAARFTIVEAEIILTDSYIDPDVVVTPGIFVQRLVQSRDRVKEIEQRTVRPRPSIQEGKEV
jgi:3-oxoacid CoA-transferase subunit A